MGRNYKSSADQQGLENIMSSLSKLQEAGQESARLGQQSVRPMLENQLGIDKDKVSNQLSIERNKQEQLLKQQLANENLKTLLGSKLPPGAGATLDGASLTRQNNVGLIDFKKSQFDTQQVNKYATALKPTADLNGAYAELENITNRDGKGGIFTNPNAQLKSAGKFAAAAGDSIIGYGGLMGMLDPDAAAERKAIRRIVQGQGVVLGGARGMSPGVQKSLADSNGMMASGDPALMAKGLRGSARLAGNVIKTAQAGFSPDIRDQAHANSQMEDPMNFYNKITPDGDPPSNYKSAPAGSAQQAAPQPQGQQDPQAVAKARLQELQKKAGMSN